MDAHRGKFFRASLLKTFGRGKQGFEWYTSSMKAGTTWRALVNQGYMPSKLRGADGGNVTARSRTKYEYVNCRGHISDYHTISSFFSCHI
jgi:hypothetical protein